MRANNSAAGSSASSYHEKSELTIGQLASDRIGKAPIHVR
jgi:hypothetical protein